MSKTRILSLWRGELASLDVVVFFWFFNGLLMWFHLDNHHQSSLDVLLWFVVLLGQVLSGGLAGDLDEGQLLAVPGHVAGRLTHAVVVVPLHQEIWRKGRRKPEVADELLNRSLCLWPRNVRRFRVSVWWSLPLMSRVRCVQRPFYSYPELGQHILCTAPGCSKVHRLEPKSHVHQSLWRLWTTVCNFSPGFAEQSFLPGMCTMRQLQLSTR